MEGWVGSKVADLTTVRTTAMTLVSRALAARLMQGLLMCSAMITKGRRIVGWDTIDSFLSLSLSHEFGPPGNVGEGEYLFVVTMLSSKICTSVISSILCIGPRQSSVPPSTGWNVTN